MSLGIVLCLHHKEVSGRLLFHREELQIYPLPMTFYSLTSTEMPKRAYKGDCVSSRVK